MKRHGLKKYYIITLLTLMLILPANTVLASTIYLAIPQQTQQPYDSICWAVAASMIADWFTGSTTQYGVAIAQDKFHSKTDFNHGAYLEDTSNYVYNYSQESGSIQNNALSFTAVQYQINNNGPIGTNIYWTSGGGHAEVIKGYTSNSNVLYNDPWDGAGHSCSYSYYNSNSSWTWSRSLYYE